MATLIIGLEMISKWLDGKIPAQHQGMNGSPYYGKESKA